MGRRSVQRTGRIDRDYQSVELKCPIKAYGEEHSEIRIYKPRACDMRHIGIDGGGLQLSIGSILDTLEVIGRDGKGNPFPDGWTDQIEFVDFDTVSVPVANFLAGGPEDGESSPEI